MVNFDVEDENRLVTTLQHSSEHAMIPSLTTVIGGVGGLSKIEFRIHISQRKMTTFQNLISAFRFKFITSKSNE